MKDQPLATGQTWNTVAYAANGRFVATLAGPVVELLAPRPGEHILDLGCGDGALTEKLTATGAIVTGVDASAAMVAAARARGLNIDHHNATELPYQSAFDAVFSNACLHWIRDAASVLNGAHRALKANGRFIAEMGGQGNIAAIRTALSCHACPVRQSMPKRLPHRFFHPQPTTNSSSNNPASACSPSISSLAQPRSHTAWRPGSTPSAMASSTALPPSDRSAALAEAVTLLRPILCDSDGNWTADYVRLRFHATRQ